MFKNVVIYTYMCIKNVIIYMIIKEYATEFQILFILWIILE